MKLEQFESRMLLDAANSTDVEETSSEKDICGPDASPAEDPAGICFYKEIDPNFIAIPFIFFTTVLFTVPTTIMVLSLKECGVACKKDPVCTTVGSVMMSAFALGGGLITAKLLLMDYNPLREESEGWIADTFAWCSAGSGFVVGLLFGVIGYIADQREQARRADRSLA